MTISPKPAISWIEKVEYDGDGTYRPGCGIRKTGRYTVALDDLTKSS